MIGLAVGCQSGPAASTPALPGGQYASKKLDRSRMSRLGSGGPGFAAIQLRGGGISGRTPSRKGLELRGGREENVQASDLVVLAEAVADTVLGASVLLGVLAISQIGVEKVGPNWLEAFQLLTWTVVVFLSGLTTVGPSQWLQKSQLFNIDTPIDEGWYSGLKKPWFNPPNWVFPLMWIPLKILQVFACYEMWGKLGERGEQRVLALPVVIFTVYKALGDVWNKVFFTRRRLGLGTLVISIYWVALVAGIGTFYNVSKLAGLLFAPTGAWVTVAASLQWSTWKLNRSDS
ncbi:unnamed protein product [Discosporangium mesarthrocarpum]